MSYNVSDLESTLRTYLLTKVKSNFPLLDVTTNSVFDDTYIKPTVAALLPFVQRVNTIDLMQDLSNADAWPEDDLDSFGLNNYGIPRSAGVAATSTVTIYYSRVSDTNYTVIPISTSFSDSTGLVFKTTQKYSFSPAEMQANYDVSLLLYTATVAVTATAVGTDYNLPANQITVYPSTLSSYIDYVTNLSSITNGEDKETNLVYATRLKTYYVSRNLGTVPGYKADIKNLIPAIEDIKVVCKGDTFMTRDIISVLINAVATDIHIGGKVDIYLKGSQYDQVTASVTINSGKLPLSVAYSKINQGTLTVTNVDHPALTVTHSLLNTSDVAYLIITNTGQTSYSLTATDTIVVSYHTNDTIPVQTTDTFECGLSKISLDTPLMSVVSVTDSVDTSIIYAETTNYIIGRTDLNGNVINSTSTYYKSSQEEATLTFVDGHTVINGTTAICTYIVNSAVKTLATHYETDQDRIATTDLLIMESPECPINIAFEFKSINSQALTTVRKAQIQTAIANYIGGLSIGDSINESDIVNALYANSTVSAYMYYVKLPFASFYTPTDITAAITATHVAASTIAPTAIQHIVLNKISITDVT